MEFLIQALSLVMLVASVQDAIEELTLVSVAPRVVIELDVGRRCAEMVAAAFVMAPHLD